MSFIVVSSEHSVSLTNPFISVYAFIFVVAIIFGIILFLFCLLCYHLLCLFDDHHVETEVSVPFGNVSLVAFFFFCFNIIV